MASMSEFISNLNYTQLENFFDIYGDPRVSEFFLMSTPGPTLTMVALYLYFCKYAGPAYMKDRKPYDLKRVIQVYNFIQVVLSVYLVYENLMGGWWNDFNLFCQPYSSADTPKNRRLVAGVWFYFFCKLIELLDTVFFILRKKMNQVSFLHVYHHAAMPILAWIGCRFLPNGHGTLIIPINSFVHVVMYTYYFLASLGPQYYKYLWWKKYLTLLQLVQFTILAFHNYLIFFNGCNYPKFISFAIGTQGVMFFYMFGLFYYQTYIRPSGKKASSPVSCNNNINNNNNDPQTSAKSNNNGHIKSN